MSQKLHFFLFGDTDAVIAECRLNATSILEDQYGGECYFEEIVQLDDDAEFDFENQKKTCREWCQIHGRGFFASTECC